jgi:hypothetical protein
MLTLCVCIFEDFITTEIQYDNTGDVAGMGCDGGQGVAVGNGEDGGRAAVKGVVVVGDVDDGAWVMWVMLMKASMSVRLEAKVSQ